MTSTSITAPGLSDVLMNPFAYGATVELLLTLGQFRA
jgi:hypothetical protein